MGTILIIDDDSAFRALLSQSLQQSGWNVFEAEDGETGIRIARDRRPDFVLCDLLMPRCNGYQVCRTLREDSALRRVRIIVTSGHSYLSDRLHALESGADDYLVKPIRLEEVQNLLRRLSADEPGEEPKRIPSASAPAGAPKVRFWGVRGSIATPGPSTVFYGGNTACVEVRADGEIIILDAGTGIRELGLHLEREFQDQPLNLTLLITHTHWDHIQGFPFFMPAYNPHSHLRVLGYQGSTHGLAETLSGQMESPYFPIDIRKVPANLKIEELREMRFSLGAVQVKSWFVNHPGVCAGYRLETSAGSVVFIPDVEPYHRLRSAPNPGESAAQGSVEYARQEDQKLREFIDQADILIMDSQYDPNEYAAHTGWGHACIDDVVELAVEARVKRLFLFHHDPTHDDETISRMVARARQLVAARGGQVLVDAAREGAEVMVGQGNCSGVP